jgi:hypothetical protein
MKKNGKIINCKECGKEFYIIFSLKNKRKFCCRFCYWQSLKKQIPWNKGLTENNDKRVKQYVNKRRNGIYKKCLFCKKLFYVPLCQNKIKFCSSGCYGKSIKGNIPWNKGLTKENNKIIAKWGEQSRKGRYGQCLMCKKKVYIPRCREKTMKFCSNECHFIWMSGENAPLWRGGISFEPYATEFNNRLKQQIKERDNYTCQICGRIETEELQRNNGKLSIHHIDYDKKNNHPTNLITFCRKCNARANFNREKWKVLLWKLMWAFIIKEEGIEENNPEKQTHELAQTTIYIS